MLDSVVCVDASIGLKLVLPEPGQAATLSQWEMWVRAGTRLVSPNLFAYETTSVIRNRVARGLIADELAQEVLIELLGQGVELLHPDGLELAAYALARELERSSAYDAFYLALGKLLDCATWTADQRLYRAVHGRVTWLRLIAAD